MLFERLRMYPLLSSVQGLLSLLELGFCRVILICPSRVKALVLSRLPGYESPDKLAVVGEVVGFLGPVVSI